MMRRVPCARRRMRRGVADSIALHAVCTGVVSGPSDEVLCVSVVALEVLALVIYDVTAYSTAARADDQLVRLKGLPIAQHLTGGSESGCYAIAVGKAYNTIQLG